MYLKHKYNPSFLFENFLEDIPFKFVWPLMPLFWTSGDACPGFESQGGSPHLLASLPVCNGFLRFTPGATPADLLAARMAGKPSIGGFGVRT